MKKLIVALAFVGAFAQSQTSFAYKEGKLVCKSEFASKKNPTKPASFAPFELDITKEFFFTFTHESLERNLYFQYIPGKVQDKGVAFFVINMAYNMANGGADVMAFPEGVYTFKIGRQDSDLIGAFFTCEAKDLR